MFLTGVLCLGCLWSVLGQPDLNGMSFLEDDDYNWKRRNNEGICRHVDGHYTCGCLFHEKPAITYSTWDEENEVRVFQHKCEQIKLPFHEDTCRVFLGNPKGFDEWEFHCPNQGFLQTWGAFAPEEGSYHIRLWYRCCNVKCPKWNCQWSPITETRKPFTCPGKDLYVQGVRAKYVKEDKDSSWSLLLCACDTSAPRDEL